MAVTTVPAPPADSRAKRLTRCTVILNKDAGAAADTTSRAIETSCGRAHLEARIVPVSGPEIERAAVEAAERGDALVAAGGDGTVSAVASVAVKTGAAFGVIPMGTLNHFARDMGIPLDVDAAVAAIAEGRTVAVDTGEVNGRAFVNNLSLGFYARFVRERQIEQRRGRRKWIAFALGVVRAWRGYQQITVRMTVDGQALVRRTPFVFVGNGEYLGEGPSPGGRASLTTGHLWISLAPECSRTEMLILVLRALAGRLTPDVPLEELRAAEVTIEPRARYTGVALDGELMSMTPPFRCVIRPRSLRTLGIPYAAVHGQEARQP